MPENEDALPLLTEETAEGKPQGDSSTPAQTSSQPSAANAPGDAGSGGGSPQQTVPLERFQEVNRQIQKYRELGLDALADEWERDPSKRMEFLARYTQGQTSPQPTPPSQPQVDPAQAQQQLQDLYNQNPLAAQAMVSKAVIEEILKKELAPLKAISKRSAIDGFKSWVRTHKPREFKAAEPYFDRIVNAYNFEGMSDQQIQGQLNQAFVAAFGAAQLVAYDNAEKTGKIRSAGQPPSMGSSGSPDASRATPQYDADVMKAGRDMAKWAGLTEDEFQKIISE